MWDVPLPATPWGRTAYALVNGTGDMGSQFSPRVEEKEGGIADTPEGSNSMTLIEEPDIELAV